MTVDLRGQLIASIRRVWFAPGDAPAPRDGTAAIEIETKVGRYVHLTTAASGHGILLLAGPASPDPGRASHRYWEDLTSEVPAGFAGRPGVSAVIPVEPASTGEPVAREWRFELSTGAMLRCRRSDRGVEIDQLVR